MKRLKILLLSGYDAASHRHWRQVLVEQIIEYDWTVLALPDRNFHWRARGNGLSFAFSHAAELSSPYDLIVATSMVDLCSLRGFVPSLGRVPALVYFHENQFAYPARKLTSQSGNPLLNIQLTNIYTALCGDRLLFNSSFNMFTFFNGARALLKKMPDCVERNLLSAVEARSSVLPVPIRPAPVVQAERVPVVDGKPVAIVWNHRWEYDKQPQVFFDAMVRLKASGTDFRLHVMGQSFREIPDCFGEARVMLAEHISTWGYQSEPCYEHILQTAHIVVSTALHDFQGLSVLEAISRGCVPLVPDRVAYPEYVPESLLYATGDAGNKNIDTEAENLFLKIQYLLECGLPEPPAIDGFMIDELVDQYRCTFEQLARNRSCE